MAITHASRAALMGDLEARLAEREGFALATVNLDHLTKLRRDPGFRDVYRRQSHVVADGNPVVWLARLAGHEVELIPGSELVLPIAGLAARLGVPVALLGSTDEALEQAEAGLAARHPGLRVVARIAPPMGFEPEGGTGTAALRAVRDSGARLCFLALGAPKQERLAARGLRELPSCGFVSVGAGLDFIAGRQRRAPRWLRRLALEWAWRLAGDPRRLARRYLDCALILPGLGLAALRQRWRTGG